MTIAIIMALVAGVLIGVSRQVNGRLSLRDGALGASFWNHAVGCIVLTIIGLGVVIWAGPGVIQSTFAAAAEAPIHVYIAGPLGVAFVAGGSVAVLRLGAVSAATLIIAGQMVGGVVIDVWRGAGNASMTTLLAIAVIIAGVVVGHLRRS